MLIEFPLRLIRRARRWYDRYGFLLVGPVFLGGVACALWRWLAC